MSTHPLETLKARIDRHQAAIGIVGLGYVGLPLAVEFAKAGFTITGLENDPARVTDVNAGQSYIADVPTEELDQLVKAGRLRATEDAAVLGQQDAVIICVPTPLRKTREPDISYILAAAENVAAHLHAGQLVVLESTTYPGTTEEIIQPMLERGALRIGREICLAFSPERVDPGNREYPTRRIPKVVGGVTPTCTAMAAHLYAQIIERVVPVSSTRTAEMVKLLENTFRSVNIALVNEMALICDHLGLDVWEIIEAAKTKPFGFMPFYPGPGIGGHCIPSDPIYLSWKARMHGFEARFIELAAQINAYMPQHVVEKIGEALNRAGKPFKDSTVFVLGVAYKADVGDIRDAPALEIIRLLRERHARVIYHDPFVPALKFNDTRLESVPLTESKLAGADCTVVVTNHSQFDYALIQQASRQIVDPRNELRRHRASARERAVA